MISGAVTSFLAVFASQSHPRFLLETCSSFALEGIAALGTGNATLGTENAILGNKTILKPKVECTIVVSQEGILIT